MGTPALRTSGTVWLVSLPILGGDTALPRRIQWLQSHQMTCAMEADAMTCRQVA